MKQRIIIIIVLIVLACLLIATATSVNRAKHLPKQPQVETQSEQTTQETAGEETQETTEPETTQTTEQETTEISEPETTEQDTSEPQTKPPTSEYDIDFEMEAELGCTFRDVYTTVVVKGASYVWVRTQPSMDDSVRVNHISGKEGTPFICIGWGENWHRLLIDGKVYYMGSAYLEEVTE